MKIERSPVSMKVNDLKKLAKLKSMRMTRRMIRMRIRKIKVNENTEDDDADKKLPPAYNDKEKNNGKRDENLSTNELPRKRKQNDNDDKSLDSLFKIYSLLFKIYSSSE